jgi:ABC-type bacteriocin/lantibiotic exporter with double-glycine peptidase domain
MQRQRVALARAAARTEAAVFVFDEALSALDPPNQHAILAALASRFHGRTQVHICHQAVVARRADQVFGTGETQNTTRNIT